MAANAAAGTTSTGDAGKTSAATTSAAGSSSSGTENAGGAGTGTAGAAGGSGDASKSEKTGAGEGTGEAGKTGESATKGGETGKAGEEKPQPKAPATYALEVPDANKAIADPALQKRIEAIARESDWTNDEAQAALNEALTLKQQEIDGWATATKADPVYGGDKLSETQQLAKRAIDRIRPEGHERRDSFLKLITGSGFGNHLEVVSFLADLGRMMSEDTGSRTSGRTTGGGADAADRMYDHPTSRAVNERA